MPNAQIEIKFLTLGYKLYLSVSKSVEVLLNMRTQGSTWSSLEPVSLSKFRVL